MNNIKAIIFDYDGVISESVDVKTRAFAKIYERYGNDIVNKVVRHHESNGGLSRFEKFKIYHNNFLGKEINKKEINFLANKFSELVIMEVINSPYVNGAINFISRNYKKYDFYISTGTPKNEIEIILKNKRIRKFFKAVYGSPTKKDLHIKEIIQQNRYLKSNIIFIGDAISDRDAALNNDIIFILIVTFAYICSKFRKF